MTLRLALPMLLLWTADADALPYGEITKGKVVVSCKSARPTLPGHDFVERPGEIKATIDLKAKRAVVSWSDGVGLYMDPLELDLSDTGHQAARVLINKGWVGIEMAHVNAKTSDTFDLKIHLLRQSDTTPYRVDAFIEKSYNPVQNVGYGTAQDILKGEPCTVAITGQ